MNPVRGVSSWATSDSTMATVKGKANMASNSLRRMLMPMIKQVSPDNRTSTNQISLRYACSRCDKSLVAQLSRCTQRLPKFFVGVD
jgi:ribosomal protein L44E